MRSGARYKPTAAAPAGAWVASVAGLVAAADYGRMVSGNEVGDCQHDKVPDATHGDAERAGAGAKNTTNMGAHH